MPTWPPWDPALGYRGVHDYTGGDPREYGIDVMLPAGAAVSSPEPGTVTAYAASTTEWEPGRLLFRLDRGGVIGFGHVKDVTRPNTHVEGGQRIATIGDLDRNSHVEFMYSPSGRTAKRSDFTSFPKSDPQSPFVLLESYMTNRPPPQQDDQSDVLLIT
jgi:hypothetical protein